MEKRMQRRGFMASAWLVVLLGIWCGPLCGPSCAAPPVQRFSHPLRSNSYFDAADELEFRDWGGAASNTPATRAMVRLDAERLGLTVELPPNTPLAAAESWLQGLSAAMGWQDATLRSRPQPEALYLRAEVPQAVQMTGFERSTARLNAARLAAELRKLSPRAVPLGIRLVGAELVRASTPPVKGGRSGHDTYLFYYLNDFDPAEGSLTLRYGVPRRWLAAEAAGLLLWLMFPPLALLAVRRYLRDQQGTEARQRLLLYRRWQRGVLVVPTLLAAGGLFLSYFSYLRYYGMGIAMASPVLIILMSPTFGLAARLIGLPLERSAWPQRAKLPWYRMASTELWLAGVVWGISICSVLIGVLSVQAKTGLGVQIGWTVLLPAVLLVGALVRSAVVAWRRKRGPLPGEIEAPPELTEPIRELTRRLQVPIEQVRLRPAREGLDVGTVHVYGSLAVIGREISEALDADQVAALVAAEALDQPRSRADRLISAGVSFGTSGLVALALVGNWLRQGHPSRVFSLLPFLVAAGPLTLVVVLVYRSRAEKRSEAADLQTAEALPDPLRMLLAFKKLEEVQIETVGPDLGSARQSVLTYRRERLARRLGME
jgi:hypothetical protein